MKRGKKYLGNKAEPDKYETVGNERPKESQTKKTGREIEEKGSEERKRITRRQGGKGENAQHEVKIR